MANEKLIYASAARRAILKADPSLAYVIDEVKAVDAVEVVHARWEHDRKNGDEVCSNCGFRWWAGCQECGVSPLNTFYCPYCGAKMDGERREGE